MTKQAALLQFFSSFGIDAYPISNVPDKAKLPYAVFESTIGSFGVDTPATVDLWFRSDSETVPNRKVDEIAQAITEGGITIPCDGGMIWIKKGSPWCLAPAYEGDSGIRRRILNVTYQFLTI